MSNAVITNETLTLIANAIRMKGGASGTMKPSQMPSAIASIPASGTYQSKTVHPSTSEQVVSPSTGYDALSSVTVEAMDLQAKSVTPTSSQQIVRADSGKDGLSSVTVAPVYVPSFMSKEISANGIYNAGADGVDGYSSVTVAVPPPANVFPKLWVNPNPSSSFAAQTVSLDLSGYDYILMRCKYHYSDTATDDNFASLWLPSDTRNQVLLSVNNVNGYLKFGGSNNYSRMVNVSTTGVTFGVATTNHNDYCIPISIYGVNGSFGT